MIVVAQRSGANAGSRRVVAIEFGLRSCSVVVDTTDRFRIVAAQCSGAHAGSTPCCHCLSLGCAHVVSLLTPPIASAVVVMIICCCCDSASRANASSRRTFAILWLSVLKVMPVLDALLSLSIVEYRMSVRRVARADSPSAPEAKTRGIYCRYDEWRQTWVCHHPKRKRESSWCCSRG